MADSWFLAPAILKGERETFYLPVSITVCYKELTGSVWVARHVKRDSEAGDLVLHPVAAVSALSPLLFQEGFPLWFTGCLPPRNCVQLHVMKTQERWQ